MIGILSWYDEEAAWLSATTASMCNAGMRHIVALDGAYLHYPGSVRHPRSEPNQHAAIREVCDALGVGHTIHAPQEPWFGGETEKRSYGFELAETLALDDEWAFLMDADQVITNTANLHNICEATTCDVADVLFYTRDGPTPNMFPVRCLFRLSAGVRVRGRHYDYWTRDDRNLWGDQPYAEPSAMTCCEVEHRTHLRPLGRRQTQNAYYQRRDEMGVEGAPALA